MFNLIKKFIALLLINWLGVYVCQRIFPEIIVTNDLTKMLLFLIVLSLLMIIVKPILDIILKPFVVLTLGILNIVINMGLVMLANNYTEAIIINNNFTLFKVTFIIGLIGFLVNLVIGLNSN
jgi:putative membrane protein